MRPDRKSRIEFGDFQTPLNLARDVCALVQRTGFSPASVVEPSCGQGSFLFAALEAFPNASHFLGMDHNAAYVAAAALASKSISGERHVEVRVGDFFQTNWEDAISRLPKPILVLGNPPWVTNATLGSLGSANLPTKTNQGNLRGIDALTGRSNFDISEWMLRKNLQWLAGSSGMLAVLCKTAVARRVLAHAWSQGLEIASAEVRRIDAQLHFGASVDACLLLIGFQSDIETRECSDYSSLMAAKPTGIFGLRDNTLVADVRLYDRRKDLLGRGLLGWRSGIKHDCSAVFELDRRGKGYVNGLGKCADIEDEVLFPLLKSSDVANMREPRKWLLVPQKSMKASPEDLKESAPKAWMYLLANAELLAQRGSSIYRDRPPFSVFGVGDYSFSPWKVAISGLYKKLAFIKVPPFQGRPVVLDDTCYFFPCQSEEECNLLYDFVQSEPAREFWSALVFWDAKRPITAQVLNMLDLGVLARTLGVKSSVARALSDRQLVRYLEGARQPLLFSESAQVGRTEPVSELDEPAARPHHAADGPSRGR